MEWNYVWFNFLARTFNFLARTFNSAFVTDHRDE